MKLYIISLYLILVGTCRSHPLVQPDSMCGSNNKNIQRQIALTGYNNDIGPCECQITLKPFQSNMKPANRNINVTQTYLSDSCNYSLFYWLDGNNTKHDIGHQNNGFELALNGKMYVQMENKEIGSGVQCFNLRVYTLDKGWNVKLTCYKLEAAVVITKATSSLSESFVSYSLTAETDSGEITKSFTSLTTMSTKDQRTTRPSKAKTNGNNGDAEEKSLLGCKTPFLFSTIILGCSVGGTVLIILLIVIVGCVLFRRQKTKISSGNRQQGEMVVIKNNINVSSDSIPNNNNRHGTKYMAEIEIIPNDLYQSSDSLFDGPNESGQHEHVPEQLEHGTKDKAVIEIIPNDLYQSSDSLADDLNRLEQHEIIPEQHTHLPGRRKNVPYTNPEYALVNKKPKKVPTRMQINQNPNKVQADYENIEKEKKTIKLEIDRIVGPKGDDYTLVNKC